MLKTRNLIKKIAPIVVTELMLKKSKLMKLAP